MNVLDLMSKLTAAVSYVYKNDAISPGLVLSTLKNGKCYASVVRYKKEYIGLKTVLCYVEESSFELALEKLAISFANLPAPKISNPLEDLKNVTQQILNSKKLHKKYVGTDTYVFDPYHRSFLDE